MGGSGAFSDGKLTLSTEVGGWLNKYCSEARLSKLIEYADQTYQQFGAPNQIYGADPQKTDQIEEKAAAAGLKLIPQRLRHLGTEKCQEVLKKIRDALKEKVEIKMKSEVKHLLTENGKILGVQMVDDEKHFGKYVVAAPGRSGAEWLKAESQFLGLQTFNNPVDIGLRVEVRAKVMEELTDSLYDPKLVYYSHRFEDKLRTFCVAPYGEVITESYGDGILTVNGQSYAEKKTDNTNFAILVSTEFTYPFREPIEYGRYLARLTNILSGGVIIQRLGDLMAGRRSTDERISRSVVTPSLSNATPGDLSFVLPHRYMISISDMLHALDKMAPGIHSRDTLLYGLEVKFYSSRLELGTGFESKIKNLFTIGDGAGVTRGLVQSSVSGVMAAREIIRQETKQELDDETKSHE